jgi:hypothetical protein
VVPWSILAPTQRTIACGQCPKPTDNKSLEVSIHHGHIHLTRSQIEYGLKEAKRSVLMSFVKDVPLDLIRKKIPEIRRPLKSSEVISIA